MFGVLKEDSASPDAGFDMKYYGDITAQRGMDVSLCGGKLVYSGSMTGLSQFDLAKEATLHTQAYNKKPVIIEAERITLNLNSNMVAEYKDSFSYREKGTVLSLVSPNVNNNSQVTYISRNDVSVGFYDNYETSYEWKERANGMDLEAIFNPTSNTKISIERAAIKAVSAPYMMLMSDRSLGKVLERVTEIREKDKDKWEVWINPGYNFASSVKDMNNMAGIEKRVKDNVIVGMGGYMSNGKYNKAEVDVKGENFKGFMYGGMEVKEGMVISVYGGGGSSKYNQNRRVEEERYDSEYNGNQYDIEIRIGKELEVKSKQLKALGFSDKVKIRPYGLYEYKVLNIDGYSEKDGVYALKFEEASSKSHRMDIGGEVECRYKERYKLMGKIFYSGLYGDRRQETEVRFIRDVDVSNLSQGEEMDRDWVGIGLNMSARLPKGISVSLGYDVVAGKKISNNLVGLKVTFGF